MKRTWWQWLTRPMSDEPDEPSADAWRRQENDTIRLFLIVGLCVLAILAALIFKDMRGGQ